MQGLGKYHRLKRQKTVYRILSLLNYYSSTGHRLSIRFIHKLTGIEMLTLRKTLTRLAKNGVLKEQRGGRNSKLYCISEFDDHIDYCKQVRDLSRTMSPEGVKDLLSYSFIKNEAGFYIRSDHWHTHQFYTLTN